MCLNKLNAKLWALTTLALKWVIEVLQYYNKIWRTLNTCINFLETAQQHKAAEIYFDSKMLTRHKCMAANYGQGGSGRPPRSRLKIEIGIFFSCPISILH